MEVNVEMNNQNNKDDYVNTESPITPNALNKSSPSDPNKKLEEPIKFKTLSKKVIEHWVTNLILSIFTVWALLADDIKMLGTTSEADSGFSISIIIIQIIFVIELVVSSLCLESYLNGFFFWLDVISIVSMLLDIHWFYQVVVDALSVDSISRKQDRIHARSAKVVSRALRVVRLVRIIRIVRFYKLKDNLEHEKERDFAKDLNMKDEAMLADQSKVGKKLADSTMKRVVLLILSMVLGIIIFNPNFYYQEITSIEFGIQMFNDFESMQDPSVNITFDAYVSNHLESTSPILYLKVGSKEYGDAWISSKLRYDEKIQVSAECYNLTGIIPKDGEVYEDQCFGVFDNRIESKLTAILNITKTVLVCVILFLGSYCFSDETNSMVIKPLDSMVKKIQKISKNPSEAKKEIEIEEYLNTMKEIDRHNRCCRQDPNELNNIETIILDKTIVKIGALLAMGYGEAGSKIIEKNLHENNGEINPMQPGEKIYGIFCHFNLNDHQVLMEVLEQNYSVLINEIFEMISEITLEFGVYNTKHVGDGVLIIWKIDEEFINDFGDKSEDDQKKLISLKQSREISEIVDSAVVCMVKILMRVQKAMTLDKYRTNQDIIDRLGPNFNLNLSMAMDMGIAIEGTAGSSFKIDISYFSPHVNTVRILESMTKNYKVNLLLTNEIVQNMSDKAKEFIKPIDSIIINESPEIDIFSIDLDLSTLPADLDDSDLQDKLNISDKKLKYEYIEDTKLKYKQMIRNGGVWHEYLETDQDFIICHKK